MEVCCKSSKGNGVTTTGNKARSSLPTLLVSVQSWLSVLTNEIRQVRKAGRGGEGRRERRGIAGNENSSYAEMDGLCLQKIRRNL